MDSNHRDFVCLHQQHIDLVKISAQDVSIFLAPNAAKNGMSLTASTASMSTVLPPIVSLLNLPTADHCARDPDSASQIVQAPPDVDREPCDVDQASLDVQASEGERVPELTCTLSLRTS